MCVCASVSVCVCVCRRSRLRGNSAYFTPLYSDSCGGETEKKGQRYLCSILPLFSWQPLSARGDHVQKVQKISNGDTQEASPHSSSSSSSSSCRLRSMNSSTWSDVTANLVESARARNDSVALWRASASLDVQRVQCSGGRRGGKEIQFTSMLSCMC